MIRNSSKKFDNLKSSEVKDKIREIKGSDNEWQTNDQTCLIHSRWPNLLWLTNGLLYNNVFLGGFDDKKQERKTSIRYY